MAILEGDIVFLKSQVMDDAPEGGGLATGVQVVDGVSNNLFPSIPQLSWAYGAVETRKIFPAVLTDNTDNYAGAMVYVAEAPADPNVHCLLFTTKSWSDTQLAAKNKLESYIGMGPETRWHLYGNHLVDQRTLQLQGLKNVPTPSIGDVLALVKTADTSQYQYVRITRVVARLVDQVFTDSIGDYLRDVLTLEISDPLRISFTAPAVVRFTNDYNTAPTKMFSGLALDAGSYRSVQPLAQAASLGDLVIRVPSLYGHLIPSALAEAPIVDARCVGSIEAVLPITGAARRSFTAALETSPGQVVSRHFGSGIARGSISVVLGGVTLTDDSNGALVATGGFTGSVDYANGAVSLAKSTGYTGNATYSAAPAASVAMAGHSDAIAISVGNRAYTYVRTLSPAPAPGSVVISYLVLGQWYSLYDDGAGNLTGDEGVGVGTVNYVTGGTILTLGALPDANSQILFSWATPAHYESHTGTTVFEQIGFTVDIASGALEPGTINLTYLAGGAPKTIYDDGASVLVGNGVGWVDYANGRIRATPGFLPDSGSNLTITYQTGLKQSATFDLPTPPTFSTVFNLAHAIEPNSVSMEFADHLGGKYTVVDDGFGSLLFKAIDLSEIDDSAVTYVLVNTNGIGGTINYATGAGTLAHTARLKKTIWSMVGIREWSHEEINAYGEGTVQVKFRFSSDAPGSVQQHIEPLPDLNISLLPTVRNSLVPGTLLLNLGGHVYVDRAGVLIQDPDHTTGSGLAAGTIDYGTGRATLSQYTGGGSPSLIVQCLTRYGTWTATDLKFRISGAPIQPASLTLRAVAAADSSAVAVSSASDGTLSGNGASGTVDAQYGIANVTFAAPIYPDTAFFNAVAYSNLPLSADILGLDPVRLPIDGKVPVIRKADLLVIHHTAVTQAMNVSNGQTINLGRVRLARVKVIGANGQAISAGYSRDLDAGTVTFTNVTGYAQPVTIEHRIEDIALCRDAQINGELALTRALTHNFPSGSRVSSALVLGNLHSRVSILFDQETWTGVWSDSAIGSLASASFNAAQFPLIVTNRGALQERWRIVFTNATQVNVIGETVGQIITGHAIVNALAPTNPATGVPYFSLPALGWGAGWAVGNVLRFNTVAANYPVWVVRTILQGNPSQDGDQFTLGLIGDVNPI